MLDIDWHWHCSYVQYVGCAWLGLVLDLDLVVDIAEYAMPVASEINGIRNV